jgi:DNA-binding CsgD family transcriptional regulator
MRADYTRYFELIASQDVESFQRRLIKIAEEFGFPLVNMALLGRRVDGTGCVKHLRNDPAEWQAFALEESAVGRDPCVELCKVSVSPFVYDQNTYIKAGAGDLYEIQAPFGFKTGISAVVRVSPNRRLNIGMDRIEPLPTDPLQLMSMLADLQLMLTFAQDTAYRLLFDTRDHAPSYALTTREREVLRWASSGKTAWETGRLLSISENTVAKQLMSAARRLGCTSKAQAVARAFELGLL